jgi:hypothetical protein
MYNVCYNYLNKHGTRSNGKIGIVATDVVDAILLCKKLNYIDDIVILSIIHNGKIREMTDNAQLELCR